MRKTSVLMAIIAMTLSTMPMAIAAGHAEITSPSAGEVIYQNTLNLAGSDVDAADNLAYWAVRSNTCGIQDDPGAVVAGNVAGKTDSFTWSGGEFAATVDISLWAPGMYCFALNTTVGAADGNRLTQVFYIVDDYAKVGGVVDTTGATKGNGTHSMEGVVGDAGAAGIVGSIVINYRELGTSCTFTPGAFVITGAGSDPGIELDGLRANLNVWDGECDNGYYTDKANIFVLDRDAISNRDAPRGAIVVRWNGGPSDGFYEIDGTPGTTGADSWVPMLKGNNHVGYR